VPGNRVEQHTDGEVKQLVEDHALSGDFFVPDKLPNGENVMKPIPFGDAGQLVDRVSCGKCSIEMAPEQSPILSSQHGSVKVALLHPKAGPTLKLYPVLPLSSTTMPDLPVGILQTGNLAKPTPAPRVVLASSCGNSKAALKVTAQRNSKLEDASPQLAALVDDPHFVLGISKEAREAE
jgi:hypothetical protein